MLGTELVESRETCRFVFEHSPSQRKRCNRCCAALCVVEKDDVPEIADMLDCPIAAAALDAIVLPASEYNAVCALLNTRINR
jgi:hypothetical protein